MIALLGILFPFIKGLLGDGLVEKVLNHKRELATNATALEKANIEADVKSLELELQRRAQIKELQIAEYEHPIFRLGKGFLLISVGLYWAARFQVRTWGLDDFGVAIKELTPTEATVSAMVLAYWFLGDKIARAIRGH
jgi:hypothetical protein